MFGYDPACTLNKKELLTLSFVGEIFAPLIYNFGIVL